MVSRACGPTVIEEPSRKSRCARSLAPVVTTSLACTSTPTCSTRSAWAGGLPVGPPVVAEVTPTRGSATAGTARAATTKPSDDKTTQTAVLLSANSPLRISTYYEARPKWFNCGAGRKNPFSDREKARFRKCLGTTSRNQRQSEGGAGALDAVGQRRIGGACANAADDPTVHIGIAARTQYGDIQQPAVAGDGDGDHGHRLGDGVVGEVLVALQLAHDFPQVIVANARLVVGVRRVDERRALRGVAAAGDSGWALLLGNAAERRGRGLRRRRAGVGRGRRAGLG